MDCARILLFINLKLRVRHGRRLGLLSTWGLLAANSPEAWTGKEDRGPLAHRCPGEENDRSFRVRDHARMSFRWILKLRNPALDLPMLLFGPSFLWP